MVRKVVLLLFLLLSCEEKGGVKPIPPLPSEIVEDFQITETERGEKIYFLRADKAYLYKSLHRIEVEEPRITFFDSKGEVYSILISRKGRIDTRTSNLLAKGEVMVKTRDSTILHTDSLLWDQRRRIIITDSWVKIESPKAVMEGEGLVSDASLERIEIKKVKGTSPYRFK